MKKLKLALAMAGVALAMGGIFTACQHDEPTLSDDAAVNAEAIVNVGPTNATCGQITSITVNTTWSSNNVYRLNGYIRVVAPATLTIQAGTRIEGVKNNRGTLFIERGAKINAVGTATAPIVFTSANTTKAAGDWGGVIICGNATINTGTGTPKENQIEGLTPAAAAAGIAKYGGSVDTDNSGSFRYVRIEYAGIIQDNAGSGNETNGLTMGGVGSGTVIDHVEVAFSNDDAFEWFGGTVNAKYLISYRNRDDDFDTDYGYKGKLQFLFALRDPAFADNDKTIIPDPCTGAIPILGSGSNGFESDNNGSSDTNTPRTQPIVSNATIYGPRVSNPATISEGYGTSTKFSSGGYGVFNRRRSLEGINNSVIFGWTRNQYNITTSTDWSATTSTNNVITSAINNTLLSNNSALAGLTPAGFTSPTPVIDFLNTATQNRVPANSANLLTTLGLPAFNIVAPNPVPAAGSILLSTTNVNGSNPAGRFPTTGTNTSLNDPFFDKSATTAGFRGAFAPASAGNVAGSYSGANGWNIPTSGASWVRYFNAGN